jgi:hypothetical protein
MIDVYSSSKILKAAVWFFAERLGFEDIDIVINVGSVDRDDVAGFCTRINDSNYYDIGINTSQVADVEELFSILAHEMVHVHQFVRGDLEDLPNGKVRWKSKTFSDAPTGSKQYYSLPWEKEAYKKQDKLTRELFEDRCFLSSLAEG